MDRVDQISEETVVAALGQSMLFQDLSAAALQAVACLGHLHIHRAGRTWSGNDAVPDGIVILVAGGIRRQLLLPDGGALTLEYCRRQGDSCIQGMLSGGGGDDVQIEPVSPESTVISFAWASLAPLEALVPTLLHRVCLRCQQQQQRVQAQLREIACYGLTARVAHTLAELAPRDSDDLDAPTHRELAELVGARQENVTKVLHHLRTEGLVDFQARQPRSLVIRDRSRLEDYN
ncbi:MAG: hypothetical protein NVS2B16_29020 [Chloroflexota bacterium]